MVKHFLKIFFVSIIMFVVILSLTAAGYMIFYDRDVVIGKIKNTGDEKYAQSGKFSDNTPLGKAISSSSRINVIVIGLENKRTDTIMLFSYDQDTKAADIISVPRDTYYPREGYEGSDTKKINAVYAVEGIEGLIGAVEKLLGIPVDKHVIFSYEGVVACVDILGGVDVNVPFNMVYDDPYDDPPLHINIAAGQQTLNGKKSLEFLRFRKGYDNQDLGRIQAQQQFIKSATNKALGLQLPAVIKEAYNSIQTDFSMSDLLSLAGSLIGFSPDNINMHTMPGSDTPLEGLSFFITDEEGIKKLVNTMYGLPVEDSVTTPAAAEVTLPVQ